MELNQLRYVLETAKYENVTRAAEALHLSQPSLSMQIKKLEEEIGISLFERTKKRVYLTEAGNVFVQQAEKILKDIDILAETMEELSDSRRGSIRVGMLPIMTHLHLDELMSDFSEEYPGYKVSISEQGSKALVQAVLDNELDAAMVILPSEHENQELHSMYLMESGLIAAVPSAHPLATKKILTARDFEGCELIMSTGNYNMQRMILDQLDAGDVNYHIAARCIQIETCFSLTSKGLGISFCSEPTAEYYHFPDITYIPLSDVKTRKIYLVYVKTPEYHPVLKSFIEFVEGYFESWWSIKES